MQRAVATREYRKGEMEVFRHKVRQFVNREKDMIDSQVLADALRCSTDEEFAYYDEFMARANGSVVKREIIAAKLEMQVSIDNRRIMRRFGR
jgi:hypothetical protein